MGVEPKTRAGGRAGDDAVLFARSIIMGMSPALNDAAAAPAGFASADLDEIEREAAPGAAPHGGLRVGKTVGSP
jgi:hypothetical protein